MDNDINLQVWLETTTVAQASVIVPYVRSVQEGELTYAIKMVQERANGRSSIGQSGQLYLQAETPTALSRLAISQVPQENCQINIVLTRPALPPRRFDFECPTEMSG